MPFPHPSLVPEHESKFPDIIGYSDEIEHVLGVCFDMRDLPVALIPSSKGGNVPPLTPKGYDEKNKSQKPPQKMPCDSYSFEMLGIAVRVF